MKKEKETSLKTIQLVVAPDGDDGADGSPERPLASPAAALEALREDLAERVGDSADAEILFRGGFFHLNETLVVKLTDMCGLAILRLCAWPGESPVFSAGRPVEAWEPAEASGAESGAGEFENLWVAEVPGNSTFCALFDAEGLLERAHSGPKRMDDVEPSGDPRRMFHFREDDIADWRDVRAAEVLVTPKHPWVVNYLPIESVDRAARTVRTALPATYPLQTPAGHRDRDLFYRIENRLADLDGPGQWALVPETGKLYLWPRDNGEPKGILRPVLHEVMRVEGGERNDSGDCPVRISGLTFSHCDRFRWAEQRPSLQHDWEFEDSANALLRLRDTDNVRVENCVFRSSGSGGLRMDRRSVDNRVSGNCFEQLGGTGITLSGFGPGSRDDSHHNTVCDNHIHHIGRLFWGSSAIFISQSGQNAIHDNLLHNLPYNGITVSGPRPHVFEGGAENEAEGSRTVRRGELGGTPLEWWALLGWKHSRFNIIEHNEVFEAVEWLGDGNGIYLSGTGEGNIVRRNYVHDLPCGGTTAGIRNDDCQFFTLVEENIVWKINAAGIITKNINMVKNNIVADCYGDPDKPFCYISLRHRGPSNGTGIRNNILFRPAGRANRRGFLEATELLAQAAVDDNLFWCAEDAEEASDELKTHQARNQCLRSMVADPLFMDAEAGDFRLRPLSPARKVGFREIPEWGIRSPERESRCATGFAGARQE